MRFPSVIIPNTDIYIRFFRLHPVDVSPNAPLSSLTNAPKTYRRFFFRVLKKHKSKIRTIFIWTARSILHLNTSNPRNCIRIRIIWNYYCACPNFRLFARSIEIRSTQKKYWFFDKPLKYSAKIIIIIIIQMIKKVYRFKMETNKWQLYKNTATAVVDYFVYFHGNRSQTRANRYRYRRPLSRTRLRYLWRNVKNRTDRKGRGLLYDFISTRYKYSEADDHSTCVMWFINYDTNIIVQIHLNYW